MEIQKKLYPHKTKGKLKKREKINNPVLSHRVLIFSLSKRGASYNVFDILHKLSYNDDYQVKLWF